MLKIEDDMELEGVLSCKNVSMGASGGFAREGSFNKKVKSSRVSKQNFKIL